jgi:hypothetical protein
LLGQRFLEHRREREDDVGLALEVVHEIVDPLRAPSRSLEFRCVFGSDGPMWISRPSTSNSSSVPANASCWGRRSR